VPVTAADTGSGAGTTLRSVARIRPGAEEIRHNARARSAIMRVAERLP
jgi:16S rRNA C1402 N4-methylase RsmH